MKMAEMSIKETKGLLLDIKNVLVMLSSKFKSFQENLIKFRENKLLPEESRKSFVNKKVVDFFYAKMKN